MPKPPLAPKTSNSHSSPWLQCRSGPQPPLVPNNSPLAPTISPLALASIGRMALVSNLYSTSADVVVQLDTVAIQTMAASARGQGWVVRRHGWLWPRPPLQPGAAVAIGCLWRQGWLRHLWSLIRLQFHTLGVQILKLYYLTNHMKNTVTLTFLNWTRWKRNIFGS